LYRSFTCPGSLPELAIRCEVKTENVPKPTLPACKTFLPHRSQVKFTLIEMPVRRALKKPFRKGFAFQRGRGCQNF